MKTNICKFLALFLLVLSSILAGQTILNPGEVVVVAINGDVDAINNYDRGFSFMPLVNLEAGTVINFTDYGWSDVTGSFITNNSVADAFIHYTAPSSIPAGTIIRCDLISHNNFTFDFSYSGLNGNNYLNLAGLSSSDELLIFQGSRISPTFIFAVTFVSTGWASGVGTTGVSSGSGSAIPGSGNDSVIDLVDDVTALSFNRDASSNDNSAYNFSTAPTTAATRADWLLRVQNYNNWHFNDLAPIPTPPSGSFTVLLPAIAPTVTTQAVSAIASTTATGNGNITALGSPNPTAHGVCWNTTGTPTISDSKVDNGAASNTGAFTAAITGLNPGTLYYVRAYATNSAQTSYGEQVSFTTNSGMSGVYTVGSGGSFSSLTKSDGLFAAINGGVVIGNITAEIISDLTENGLTALNQWTEAGSGNYTLTIQPRTGDNLLRTISGDGVNVSSALIYLNGADRVVFDGTTGKYLAFAGNSAKAGYYNVFWLDLVDNCKITNCLISNTNTANTEVTAVLIDGASNEISKNKIYNLNGSANADITGIFFSGTDIKINNNMLSLIPVTTGPLSGITVLAGTVNLYYNSIFIGGTQSGTNNSIAYNRTMGNSTAKNNIFYNARTNTAKAGSGKHYAVYQSTTSGTIVSDYNLLYSAAGNTGRWGATECADLVNWRSTTGLDLNSQSSTLIFEDYSSGDLRFTRATANSAVFDKGTPVAGITDDYFSKSRTALFYTQVDIGAYELAQSSGLEENILPFETNLAQNYPNPFNPMTAIRYDLRIADKVKLSIFNTKGELVKTLVNGLQNAGRYSVNFDGAGFNSGVYFYKLEADGKNLVKRMLLVK